MAFKGAAFDFAAGRTTTAPEAVQPSYDASSDGMGMTGWTESNVAAGLNPDGTEVTESNNFYGTPVEKVSAEDKYWQDRAAREADEAARAASEKAANDKRRRDDAYATAAALLDQYGLGSLADEVFDFVQRDLSPAEIEQAIRKTPEFDNRFPGIKRREKKGLAPISPGEYVAYERNARQLFRAAGLPEGFYDTNEDFTKFIENDLSLSELADRVTLAANHAFKMPKEDREELARWGLGPGDLTAFWINPDVAQPLLERKYAAAQLSGAAKRTGFGGLEEAKATELVGTGITAAEAEQGFGQLVQAQELFGALDRGEDEISKDEQIGARFGGNSFAQQRIEARRRRRQATFEGGGGFAASQQGLTGLGGAERT